MNILICIIIGLVIAAIVVGSMVSQLKTVRKKYTASDYQKANSFKLRTSNDHFLYKKVTKTPIQNNK